MKKWKRSCGILLCVLFVLLGAVRTGRAEDMALSVTVRIEGISQVFFYETLAVPAADGVLTVQELFQYVDEQSEEITITGIADAYITAVNNETAAQFGGWDGWLYRVNQVEAAVGIDAYELADGDEVVLYYGDPYGVGMQYPEFSYSDGVLTVVSKDTTYDESWNPVITENPIVAAMVTWDGTEYETDADGKIMIKQDGQVVGAHSVQITKISEQGLPLVLRVAPDFTVAVEAEQDTAPKAGEDGAYLAVYGLLAFAVAGLLAGRILRREWNVQ